MDNKKPKTTDGLMRHIRNNKDIGINGSKQKDNYGTLAIFMGIKVIVFFKKKTMNYTLTILAR
ncbi:hypothetical protein [Staphylococcus sp. GDX8P106P-2]|uniref:hypothetical protein n=1 Tax=Staphylococcus sp. GDX8P106P-2 TaxID=2804108 RepID=UPI001FD8C7E3|nr:hypothetical protein [Staphylococcus sp. GDX8P106P-2]